MKRIILAISIMILGTTIHAQDKELHVEFNTTEVLDFETREVQKSQDGVCQLHFYKNELVVSSSRYMWIDRIRAKYNDGDALIFTTVDNATYFIYYNEDKNIIAVRIVTMERDVMVDYFDRSDNIKVPQYFLDLPSYPED